MADLGFELLLDSDFSSGPGTSHMNPISNLTRNKILFQMIQSLQSICLLLKLTVVVSSLPHSEKDLRYSYELLLCARHTGVSEIFSFCLECLFHVSFVRTKLVVLTV